MSWRGEKPRDGRYGVWAGNERGHAEDKSLCVQEVSGPGGWHHHQCSRKRGFGPNGEWCKQHAKWVKS